MPSALPGRACGTCTLCCRLPDIEAFAKPANAWCSHCVPERGCAIYDERPALCRDFLCLWMTSEALGPEWTPSRAHMMVYVQGPQTTVLVDPDFPEAWRSEPHATQLRRLAREAEASGGYVIVFVGDEVFKVEPLDDARKDEGRREQSAATA
ncbi:MAG: hypothetical protein ACK4N1_08235 [Pseudorhizobium sp.]